MQTLIEKKEYISDEKKLCKGLIILNDADYDTIYGKSQRDEINKYVDLYMPQMNSQKMLSDLSVLEDAEVIFSGWGPPVFTDEVLDAAPNLKAIFYAAGSVKGLGHKGELFDRGIMLTSSVLANCIPVAEFCLSQILFSLKLGWHHSLKILRDKKWMAYENRFKVPGCYRSTVGIISLGAISRKLVELLRPFDIDILVSSSYLKEDEARSLGVKIASVEEIFQNADVVSLHTPAHHKGIITGEHFRMMKENATFLNTARGICVRETEMIEALRERKDIMALLDVTYPEPPIAGCELFDLPNVVTFPHISGSMNNECHRMAQYAIDEFHRYIKGEPLKYEVSKKQWEYMA
ncbi:MAG: hydroxyacid dehydrogenase [Sedimentisphaeraceae bacterium JB056]